MIPSGEPSLSAGGAGGIRPTKFSGYIEKYPSQKQEQGIAANNMISGHKDTEDAASRKNSMPQTDSYSAEGDASSEDIARRLKLDKGLGPSCVCSIHALPSSMSG